MSKYFQQNHRKVELLPSEESGLRTPQLGASGALLSHGTRTSEPAVVVLPTGTGKTAVLQLTPFLWSTGRVLVITPSRLVREQIASGFEHLDLLKSLGVLPDELQPPNVISVPKRLSSAEMWSDLRDADVVVTTPMSASPSIEGISEPPSDLFDLVMVDEAHHSPAISYANLLDAFPNARKAFFTATPFRRDRKFVAGKLVYNYPLRSAIDDGTYGRIEYLPCEPNENEDHDLTIASMAESAFDQDRNAGLDHRLMVRTDSVTRAKYLEKLYAENTELRLRLVHGGHSMKHVNSVVKKLKSGDLDGVICVDMFGEGVDFPRLKIAALHAPHRSLAITLQFVGRFARTNAEDIGSAKFIAVPQEIDAEVRELYKSGASWEELVANLADARVEEEESLREGLGSFETDYSADTDTLDLTVDSLHPYFHAKVLRTDREPCLDGPPYVPRDCELVFHAVSDDLSAAVVVCRRLTKPKWLEAPALLDTRNLLYIIHYDRTHGLLFVNSQEHGEEVYESIVESLYDANSDEVCIPLPHEVISRALRILSEPSFYNLGMRNREIGGQDESYRTLTGPKADRRVSRTDGNTRSRGHVFGGGMHDGESVTLGVSTLSKLWSNKYGLIPQFVSWCSRLAAEISAATPVRTGSNLDLLDTGQHVSKIPAPVIGVVWHEHVYRYPQLVRVEGTDEDRDLTGLELVVRPDTYNEDSVDLEFVVDDEVVATYRLAPEGKPMVRRVDAGPQIIVRGKVEDGTLEEFLQLRPPTLFLADFSTLIGRDWYRGAKGTPLDPSVIRTFTDFGQSVDIECEVSDAKPGLQSIHEFTETQFLSERPEIVIYDHRTGEVADYVTIAETDDSIICQLAHCKGAGGKRASSRVNDAYEVAGQVVKCLPYRNRPEELREKLVHRLATGSEIKRGSVEQMERLLSAAQRKRFEYRVCLVQPGLSASKLTESVAAVLAAASEYVADNTGLPPSFWLSP